MRDTGQLPSDRDISTENQSHYRRILRLVSHRVNGNVLPRPRIPWPPPRGLCHDIHPKQPVPAPGVPGQDGASQLPLVQWAFDVATS